MLFHSIAGPLPQIPDDLTIPQFILDSHHELRQERPKNVPWLIADKSARVLGLDEVRTPEYMTSISFNEVCYFSFQLQKRTNGLAVGLRDQFSLGELKPVDLRVLLLHLIANCFQAKMTLVRSEVTPFSRNASC